MTCISDPTVSEAPCRRKHSLPAAREDVLKYKGRRGLPQAEEREEEGGSGRWGTSVAHQDLDLLLIFSPDLPCDVGQPAIIFFAEVLSVFCMSWKGQCSAPWQMGCMPTWSPSAMLGTAPHHRVMERNPGWSRATGRDTFCLQRFTKQETSRPSRTCCRQEDCSQFRKGLGAFFQKSNCSSPSFQS